MGLLTILSLSFLRSTCLGHCKDEKQCIERVEPRAGPHGGCVVLGAGLWPSPFARSCNSHTDPPDHSLLCSLRPSQPGATPTCGRPALRSRTSMRTSEMDSSSCSSWRSFQVRLLPHNATHTWNTCSVTTGPRDMAHPICPIAARKSDASTAAVAMCLLVCLLGWSLWDLWGPPYSFPPSFLRGAVT